MKKKLTIDIVEELINQAGQLFSPKGFDGFAELLLSERIYPESLPRVLVACEYSGKVREAFRKLGFDAWSCDLLPSDDNSSYHIQGDVLDILADGWDLMIAHPPCTYLTNAGVTWLHKQPGRWELMREGAEFFKALLDAPIPLIAVENPIMHKYAVEIIGRRQDQVLQPWMFGHMERKATCLWLKGLPSLKPTNNVQAKMLLLPKNVQQRLHYLPPSKDRWKLRSETYQGIADAMSQQWGNELLKPELALDTLRPSDAPKPHHHKER